MKKIVSLCAMALFLTGTAECFATDAPKAAAPAVAPAAAPAAAPAVVPPPPPAPELTKGQAPPPRAPVAPKINKVGMAVPAWEAKSAEDATVFTGDKFKGKAYGIVFVNSSCSACRGELAQLSPMIFSSDFTLLIAAVDVKLDRTVKLYKDDLKVPFPVVDDSKFLLGKIFGIGFTPASVIVGKDGNLEYWGAGYTAESDDEILAAFGKYVKK